MIGRRFMQQAGFALLAFGLIWAAARTYEARIIAQHKAAEAARNATATAKAAAAGQRAAAQSKGLTESENERARQAAEAGADYLGDALRELRGQRDRTGIDPAGSSDLQR